MTIRHLLAPLTACALLATPALAQVGVTPSQQITTSPEDEEPLDVDPGSIDIGDIIGGASPEIIRSILENSEQIDAENQTFVDEINRLAGSGLISIDAPRSGGVGALNQIRQLPPGQGPILRNLSLPGGTLGQAEQRPNPLAGTGEVDENLLEDERYRALYEFILAQRRAMEEVSEIIRLLMQQAQEERRDAREGSEIVRMSNQTLADEIERLRSQAETVVDEDEPSWLADYRYVQEGRLSPALPEVFATWLGRVGGTSGTDTDLDGQLYLGFGLVDGDYLVGGSMTFEGEEQGVEFTGAVPSAAENRFTGQFSTAPGDSFFGGTITGPGSLEGAFYGPGAEQVGGQWSFDVVGGSLPGTAQGIFAGQQHATE